MRYLLLALVLIGLGGCSEDRKKEVLKEGQLFNDKVQAAVFDSSTLSPYIPDGELTPEKDFRINGKDKPTLKIDTTGWMLEVRGNVKHPGFYSLQQIQTLGKQVENVRHVCVEGWSIKVKWAGTRLSDFLDWVGVDPKAKYLFAECADNYYVPYDMASVRHPQSLLCYEAYGKPLTIDHGAPVRIVMPTKLGYKSAKWLKRITVTDKKPGGYWEDKGYDWHGGI
jgi:DMSO/TMAO reductase YedYZ molybdopterin-dependent catalytic subunit